MARKSIEDLDRNKDTEPLMDLMYSIDTSHKAITCRDNITNTLTDIPYTSRKDREKNKDKNKKKSKSGNSNKSNTTSTTTDLADKDE
jgi:hypothetical protein